MKFERNRGGLSQAEAAEVLSERPSGARGGGSRRSLRPPPGPLLGAARAGGRGGAGAGVVRHPLLGLHGQALPRKLVADHGFKRSYNLAAAELASDMGAGARRPGVGRTGASGRAVPCPA